MANPTKQRALQIFEGARSLDGRPLDSFLTAQCGGDVGLRREVERLLEARLGSTAVVSGAMVEGGSPPPTIDAPLDASPGTVQGEVLQELAAAAAPQDGGRIGPYRIVKPLGAGGMGSVYLAEQEKPVRRNVAVKVIKLGMDTQEIVARFEAERQALAMMDHENIAKVFDAGATTDGRPYFVMEHVKGVPITEYCDANLLGLRDRLHLFMDVCDAVQHAHHKGIIHRDLKPSNVLVAEQGTKRVPKIIDFGIAKAVHQRLAERTLLTEQGVMIGTPEYMSPEQAAIGDDDIDTRSDVYSLGVLLYEMIVGSLPFPSAKLRAAGFLGIQRIIREEDPPPPSSRLLKKSPETTAAAEKRSTGVEVLVRQIRGDLDWIALKSLEKDRTRRYGSAAELAADVGRYLNDEPILARPHVLTYRLQKFCRRHRKLLTVTGAVLALLLSIAWATWHTTAQRALLEKAGRSGELRAEGVRLLYDYRRSKEQLAELETAWREAVDRQPGWAPIWERREELAAWDALERARNLPDARYLEAVQRFNQAFEVAPTRELRTAARRALEAAYWQRYREASREDGVRLSADYFAGLVKSIDLGTYASEIEGRERLLLEVSPEGAEVFCFRYQEHEKHLIPIPFDPRAGAADFRAGLLGAPFLQVKAVRGGEGCPFEPGDRLRAVAGKEVRLMTDLAGAIAGLEADRAVEAVVQRGGREVRVAWVPFPSAAYAGKGADAGSPFQPGRLVEIPHQLGISFSGYPLDLDPRCRIGTASAQAPLQVEFPRGSYLLVVRKEGHAEVRFPVSIPIERPEDDLEMADVETFHIRLVPLEELPEGYVHVPAGRFGHGHPEEPHREELFQSLPNGTERLDDFFIGRHEVTLGEYLQFLDDPEVLARTDESGTAEAATDDVQEVLRTLGGKLRLVPLNASGRPYLERTPEGWKLPDKWEPTWPVFSVQQVAAREYAAWLTRRSDRWVFRLPTDLEWEKAARGVDRRRYPWGDYLVWDFCTSALGRYVRSPVPVGSSPLDESPYGLEDVVGSVSEHTSGAPASGLAYTSLRGGSWVTTDAYRFRIVTRFGRHPAGAPGTDAGFRLVAVRK